MTTGDTQVLRTERLSIAQLTLADAEFIIELLNEPSFVRFIGDREVRTDEDAQTYLSDGPLDSYQKNGFGLLKVSSSESPTALGICGLVKREALSHPDLGFAFLESQWGNGYAIEASRAVLQHAASKLGLQRILAIVNEDNDASIRLLTKTGFEFEKMVRMPGEAEDICQYAVVL